MNGLVFIIDVRYTDKNITCFSKNGERLKQVLLYTIQILS